MQQPSDRSAHARRRNRIARAGWWVHFTGAIALIVGLFMPLVGVPAATAAPELAPAALAQSADNTVPAAPTQVTATGDFGSIPLTNSNGIWTGVSAVPPGQYQWQIQAFAPDGTTYTYGPNGLGDSAGSVSVGDGDAGLYFSLDTHTNATVAAPVTGIYSISVDGASVALQPSGGQLTALVTSGGGTASVQVFDGGAPLGDPLSVDLATGPNRLTFTVDGQLANVEPLQGGSVTIERLDANGSPLPGGCYQLRSGGIVNQGCDADDGADGYTRMTFPAGMPGGTVDVIEVTAPGGAEPIDPQQIQLQGGDQTVTLQPAASATETPTETETPVETETPAETATSGPGEITQPGEEQGPPGDLLIELRDDQGNPIGGACFQLLDAGGNVVEESCDQEPYDPADFANNGTTGFFGVPSGDYTLRLTQAPNGATAADMPVTVVAGQQTTETVTATGGAIETETPAPTATATVTETVAPTEAAQRGDLTITLLDGTTQQPIGGACFQLIDGAGNVAGEACDTTEYESEQFANNGNTGFFDVPAGSYTLHLSAAPEGVTVPDQPVTVNPGGDDNVTVTAQVTPTETETAAPTQTAAPTEIVQPTEAAGQGDFTVQLRDQDSQQPIGGACFQLLDANGTVVSEACDTADFESDEFANNGNTGFFGVPAGTYTLHMSSAPEGVTAPQDQPVTVVADTETTVTVTVQGASTETPVATETAAPTETAPATQTESAQPGPPANLVVELRDPATGEGVGGACFTLEMTGQDPITSCDANDANPGNGRTGFYGVPSGEYTLTESTVPEGTSAIEPRQITIQPGDNPDLVIELGGEAQRPTQPTETSTSEPTDGVGTVTIDVSAIGGSNICVELNTVGGIGFASPPTACDNGDGDANNQPGIIEMQNIEPGQYVVSVISGAEGIPDQTIDVSDSGPTKIILGQAQPTETVSPTQPSPTTGTLTVTVADANGAVSGACVDVSNPSGTFTFCDGDNADGTIEIDDVVFGVQTIAMSTVPPGYRTPEPQTVELSVDQQTATVGFTLEAAVGSIAVTVTDANGGPIADACVAVDGGEPQCTGAEGTVTFDNIPVGAHTVTETSLPEGYTALDPVNVTVEDGQSVPANFEHPSPTGAIQVTSVNVEQTPVAGACVAIDGGDPLCDVDGDGVLNFPDIPAGGHEIAQTTPPDGYQQADPATQTVDVAPGETASVTFTSEAATGGIAVTVSGPDGLVPGVCVAISADGEEGQTLCEPGDDGAYRFSGLAPVTWTVTVSQVPDTLVTPEPQTVDVTVGQEATVDFALSAAQPDTGSALLTLVSEDGQAASGVCLALVPQDGGDQLGPFCDNAEGQDGDATEGVILIEGIPAGSYEMVFPDVGAAANTTVNALRQQTSEPIIITIVAGETLQQTITVPGLLVFGSIEIDTTDAATGDPVPGACYTVDTAEPTIVCDADTADGSTEDGTVLIGGLPAGDYTVTMSTPPPNYGGADPQPATVTSGGTAQLEFRVTAEVTTGTLTISKVDGDTVLPGACFRLDGEGGPIGPICDSADGADDGTITFSDVPAGTWTLVETRTPSNEYAPIQPRQVTIEAGENLEIEVPNTAAPGRLNVIKVDAADQTLRLEGACFRLDGDTSYGPFCDGDDLNDDGRTVFTNVVPGTYTLVETQAPSGYDAAPDREVTIRAGVTHQITVQDQKTPPPPESGTLVVNKLDENNDTLAGGCFRLFDGDSAVTGRVCDNSDGTNDGRIVFEKVPVGTWTLREVLAPSPDYQLAADQQVTIENGKTTEVDVVDKLKLGRILVRKVTPQGGPIQGACFQLDPSQGDPRCSDANGRILFENVPVGTYTLNETTTPFGFKQAAPVKNVKVNPGQTTVVTVRNERQPPPNTGTVQIRKFVCPVDTADQERTSFLGGAAGSAELAKTKGCAQANAEFTMIGEDGKDGPGAFATGDDGVYIVTVPAKIYRLDETNPDLPGNSAALLRVEVGRMTTVVVINYVAPPAPEPVNISVAKYTCQAGFNGTTFEDFAASCMNDNQLTNNITIRAEGPVNLKAVTGDGGKAGRTAFVDQPAGTYTIYEERPYNIPTNYVFCGWDANWPADFKRVNGAVTAELGEGASLSCVFFNIPEPVTDSTGVILVRKYVCDVDAPPKGYKFADECRLSDQNATFELKQYNEETTEYGNAQQKTANPDGILRFINLRPGSYQLREVGDNWCYANSNSVNSKGDVVVKAGQVSLVSIYNCVGTSQPPNTGSGDAAELLNPPEATAPAMGEPGTTPGIAWPVGILAAVFALWPRKVLAPGRDGTVPSGEDAGDIAA